VTSLAMTASLSVKGSGSGNEIRTAIGTVTVIAIGIATASVSGTRIVSRLRLVMTPAVHHLRVMKLVRVDHHLVMMLARVHHRLVILDTHPATEVDHDLVMMLARVHHRLAIQDIRRAMEVDHLRRVTILAEVHHRLAIQDTHIAMEVDHLLVMMLAEAHRLVMMLVRVDRLLAILDTHMMLVGRVDHHRQAILDILGTHRHRMTEAKAVRLPDIRTVHLLAIRMVAIHPRTWVGHPRIQVTAMAILHLAPMDILHLGILGLVVMVRVMLVARVILAPRVTLVARASPMVDIMVTEATLAVLKKVETLAYQVRMLGKAQTTDMVAPKATTATAPGEATLARATLAKVAMVLQGEIEMIAEATAQTAAATAVMTVVTETVAAEGGLRPRFS